MTTRQSPSVEYTRWKGIERVSDDWLRRLAVMALRNGWEPNALAGTISHESGFNPSAKHPGGSASGLLQWIDSTARTLGTTAEKIRKMSAYEQLPLIERYLHRYGHDVSPLEGADFMLIGLGKHPRTPLDRVLFRKGEPAYDANVPHGSEWAVWDLNQDGTVTVQEVRDYWDRWEANNAKRGTITLKLEDAPQAQIGRGDTGAGWIIALALLGGAGVWAQRQRKRAKY
jgi:hypothetical protein